MVLVSARGLDFAYDVEHMNRKIPMNTIGVYFHENAFSIMLKIGFIFKKSHTILLLYIFLGREKSLLDV